MINISVHKPKKLSSEAKLQKQISSEAKIS